MIKLRLAVIAIIGLFVAGFSPAMFAQVPRVWVSGVGDDANPCTSTAPCRTFSRAHEQVAAGGEISVLNPGNYGIITISKSVTISGIGALAGINWSGASNGITINAGSSDVVTIRNLSFFPASGSTGNAIRYSNGAKVHIENCSIQNTASTAIQADLANSGILTVSKTTITGTGSVSRGIDITTTTGILDATFNDLTLRTSEAMVIGNNVYATVTNSAFYGGITAILLQYNGYLNLDRSIVSGYTTAINCNNSLATVRLSNASIINNATGITGSGRIISFNNNTFLGNGTNSNIPLSVLQMQ